MLRRQRNSRPASVDVASISIHEPRRCPHTTVLEYRALTVAGPVERRDLGGHEPGELAEQFHDRDAVGMRETRQ